MTNVELRNSFYFIFKKNRAKRFHHSSFDIRRSSFHLSYKVSDCRSL
ncbi:hypothetical protein D1AOALGA4SA_1586 [Olavius algarvensis Delta 1 endosymbiont]|nr:hypothetical protein D1AOALGA4SA_1586 [Olavius algarvensis Delta 1 endosymbiont]